MSTSSVRVTEGSGPYLWTDQRSVASVNREAQYVLLAEPALPTFTALAASISIATANDHVIELMAGSSNYVRIHRIKIEQGGSTSGTAEALTISILRLTTAGTGGTSVTPRPFDTADTATATAMTLPSSKGTEGVELLRNVTLVRKAVLATSAQSDDFYEWTAHPRAKPIIIPAGTSNGICVKNTAAYASASLVVEIEFTETAWL